MDVMLCSNEGFCVCFVVSGTLINFLDVFMLNTRRVGLMCSVRYCAVILSHSIYILLFLA